MELRYVVARLIPDLVREEPINVGIILQSDNWVGSKFIQRVPKNWGLTDDLVQDVAVKLDTVWKERLSKPEENIYLGEERQTTIVRHTDRRFLDWLHATHVRQLQFSEIRLAEVNISDAFEFETLLLRLYGMFVAPKPRLRVPIQRGRLHQESDRKQHRLS